MWAAYERTQSLEIEKCTETLSDPTRLRLVAVSVVRIRSGESEAGTLEALDFYSAARDFWYVQTAQSGTYTDSQTRIANGKAAITVGGFVAERFTPAPVRYVYSVIQSLVGSGVDISQTASHTQISPPSGPVPSYRTARTYGLTAQTELTADNADAISNFITQFVR
jgi:hypothetical protein